MQAPAAPKRARRAGVPTHDTLARIAVGFRISVGTAHAYVTAVASLLADRAPVQLKTLREHDLDIVLLDGPRHTHALTAASPVLTRATQRPRRRGPSSKWSALTTFH